MALVLFVAFFSTFFFQLPHFVCLADDFCIIAKNY